MRMKNLARVGQYELRVSEDLGLSEDVRCEDQPPLHHFSWVAQRGLVFALTVIDGVAGKDQERAMQMLARSHAEFADEFSAAAHEEFIDEVGPGIKVVASRARLSAEENDGVSLIAEKYSALAHGDIVDFELRFKNQHVERADEWRRLFFGMVFDALIRRGNALG